MRRRSLFVLAALGAAACASSGQGSAEAGGDDSVQLVIINQYSGTVTAYAVWGAGRIRLGDIGSNRERTFFPDRRSDRVAVGFEAIGAPPPGTTSGATRFRGGGDSDPSSPRGTSESIAVVAGDAIEVRISAAGIITVRRLEPGL
jgi:hypothetical protein